MAGTEAGPPCGAPGANEENGMTTVTDSFDAEARMTPRGLTSKGKHILHTLLD